jgi:phosphatidylglycerophosphate synthase
VRVAAWLPDAVTLSRVALLPVLVIVADAAGDAARAGLPSARLRTATLLVLLVIALSDKLDGFLARRTGHPPTRRGALLDAASDRLSQWTGGWYFTLRAAPAFTPLPLWFPLLLVARDAVLLVAWLAHPRRTEVRLEHEMHGKSATVAVFLLLLLAVLGAPSVLVSLVAVASGALVVYSALGYASRMKRERAAMQMKDEARSEPESR